MQSPATQSRHAGGIADDQDRQAIELEELDIVALDAGRVRGHA